MEAARQALRRRGPAGDHPLPGLHEGLRLTVTTNRNGNHAIGLHCPQDGRHSRGFINHKPFVEDALTRMAEAEEERQAACAGTAAPAHAVQNDNGGPPTKRSPNRARTA